MVVLQDLEEEEEGQEEAREAGVGQAISPSRKRKWCSLRYRTEMGPDRFPFTISFTYFSELVGGGPDCDDSVSL